LAEFKNSFAGTVSGKLANNWLLTTAPWLKCFAIHVGNFWYHKTSKLYALEHCPLKDELGIIESNDANVIFTESSEVAISTHVQ